MFKDHNEPLNTEIVLNTDQPEEKYYFEGNIIQLSIHNFIRYVSSTCNSDVWDDIDDLNFDGPQFKCDR